MKHCTKTHKRRKGAKADRPAKPYPDFPLCPHPTGYWCKIIRGKLHYFGRWGHRVKGQMERLPDDGWKQALELYQQQRDDLYAGRPPRVNQDGLAMAGLRNHFLTFKKSRVTTGELSFRSFLDYKRVTDLIVGVFGKTTSNEITRIRVVFNFAFKHDLIDKPIRFGAGFNPPQQKIIRKALATNGPRMFEAAEIHKLRKSQSVAARWVKQAKTPPPAKCSNLGRLTRTVAYTKIAVQCIARSIGYAPCTLKLADLKPNGAVWNSLTMLDTQPVFVAAQAKAACTFSLEK